MTPDSFYLSGEDPCAEPYRYRACGLEGIYLLNGYLRESHDGEEHVTITDVDGLHQEIGRHLVLHRKALSPKEIRFLRNTMDLTQSELAERLGNTSQSVARWEKGECEIPGAAEKLLRANFILSLMTKEEIAQILKQLEALLVRGELDQMDSNEHPAQFELFGSWAEKKAA